MPAVWDGIVQMSATYFEIPIYTAVEQDDIIGHIAIKSSSQAEFVYVKRKHFELQKDVQCICNA